MWGVEDEISGKRGSDRVTDGATREGDRDNKYYIFENNGDDGAGTENDTLDFGDRAASEVTRIRDEDVKSNVFEDGGDNRAGVENDTLDFGDRAMNRVIGARDGDDEGDPLNIAAITE